jgi:hypothetical protein
MQMTVEQDLRKLFIERYGNLSQARTEVQGAKNSIDAFMNLVDQLPQGDKGSRFYDELTRRLTEASHGLSLIFDGALRS